MGSYTYPGAHHQLPLSLHVLDPLVGLLLRVNAQGPPAATKWQIMCEEDGLLVKVNLFAAN
jgi:hypothetical protein